MLRQYVSLRVRLFQCASCTRWMSADAQPTVDTKKMLVTLRSKTNFPLINCKEALKATNYDMEKAEEHLIQIAKEKGWKKMQFGKQNMSEGLVSILTNKNVAAIVEVNCETDFVAKTAEFQGVVKDIAQTALNNFATEGKISVNPDDLLNMAVPGKEENVKDVIAVSIGKLKENILIKRAHVVAVPPTHHIGVYIHPFMLQSQTRPPHRAGSYAAMVAFSVREDASEQPHSLKQKGRMLAQHIVGMHPTSIGTPPAPKLVKRKKKKDFFDEELESDSFDENSTVSDESSNASSASSNENDSVMILPPNEKSAELLKQPFLLESDVSVAYWLNFNDLEVHDFVRYKVGELNEVKDS